MENKHLDLEIGSSDQRPVGRGTEPTTPKQVVHGAEPTTPKQEDTPLNKSINGHSNNTPSSSDQDQTTINVNTTLGEGIQRCFTTASNLGNFLPTGTNLIFAAILPTIHKSGQCSSLTTTIIIIVLALCAFFCFLLSFTDSLELSDNNGKGKKTVYGFVTTKGLWVHNHKGFIEDERYKLGFGDVLHATMSVVVFLAIAFSDRRVIDCLLPRWHVNDVEQVMQNLVLVVGFVCSTLFLLFPVNRRGFVPVLPKNASTH